VGNDGIGAAGDGHLGHHVVIGVAQERSPEEEDWLLMSD
jgi:hypothetical protein